MIKNQNQHGLKILAFSSLIAIFLSIYNYASPSSGIDHTGGAMLVIGSSLVIFIISSCSYYFMNTFASWERGVIYSVLFLALLGTLLAAFLLEAWFFLAVIVICFCGWFLQILNK